MATQGQKPDAGAKGSSQNQPASYKSQANGGTSNESNLYKSQTNGGTSNPNAGNENHQPGFGSYNDARQKTGEVIDQVQEKAGEVVEQVRDQVTSQISSQKDRLVEGAESVAGMVRMGSDQLRRNNQPGIAQYTDQAAKTVEDFSTFLRERQLEDIVGEVEKFARREPVLFLGGAFTVGLLAARFLKSSKPSQPFNPNSQPNALARRQGDGFNASTTAPLAPPPVTSVSTRTDGYSATASNPQSSVARHFGEAEALGQDAESSKTRLQNEITGVMDSDVL